MERVPEQTIEPVDNTPRRHYNCKLTKVFVGPRSPTLQYAQKVNILQRIRTATLVQDERLLFKVVNQFFDFNYTGICFVNNKKFTT